MKWSLVTVVMRPKTAWAALFSQTVGQTVRPSDVVVMDNGPVSVLSAVEYRFVMDACAAEGIAMTVRRFPFGSKEPGWLHAEGARAAEHDAVAFGDDDALWEPDMARSLRTACRSTPWAVGSQLTPNPERPVVGWSHPSDPAASLGFCRWSGPVDRGSTHAFMFRRTDEALRALREHRHAGWDDALTGALGRGVRVSDAGWEMASDELRRWRAGAPA